MWNCKEYKIATTILKWRTYTTKYQGLLKSYRQCVISTEIEKAMEQIYDSKKRSTHILSPNLRQKDTTANQRGKITFSIHSVGST